MLSCSWRIENDVAAKKLQDAVSATTVLGSDPVALTNIPPPLVATFLTTSTSVPAMAKVEPPDIASPPPFPKTELNRTVSRVTE